MAGTWSGAAEPAKETDPPLTRLEWRARALSKLDAAARNPFGKEHPGVVPELTRKLPSPTIAAFNWVDRGGVSGAHKQKAGDCWANALTEALECNWLIRNGVRVYLSPQPLLDRTQNVDAKGLSTGNNYKTACDLLLKHGTAGFRSYPYTGKPGTYKDDVKMPFRIVAWGNVAPDDQPPTVQQLKQALVRHGPLAISLYASESFRKFRGRGVYYSNFKQEKPITNHCVLLVGWDDHKGKHGAWRIRNSWGPSWGDDGYAWVEYGSNNVGVKAVWLRAQSIYYRLPDAAFLKLVPDGESLPRWKSPLDIAKEKEKGRQVGSLSTPSSDASTLAAGK